MTNSELNERYGTLRWNAATARWDGSETYEQEENRFKEGDPRVDDTGRVGGTPWVIEESAEFIRRKALKAELNKQIAAGAFAGFGPREGERKRNEMVR